MLVEGIFDVWWLSFCDSVLDVTMKVENDDDTIIFSFISEEDAADELIRFRVILKISREIDVDVKKLSMNFRFDVLDDIWITDEVKSVIEMTDDLHRVLNWILTTELLNQIEKHVSHKSLDEWSLAEIVMMIIHVELQLNTTANERIEKMCHEWVQNDAIISLSGHMIF